MDASVPRDVLDIQGQDTQPETERVIGSYMVNTTMEGGVSVSELKLIINAVEDASTYTLTYGEQGIYTTDPRPVTESFSYLTLLIASLEDVSVKLYDKDGAALLEVRFDPSTQELVADMTGG